MDWHLMWQYHWLVQATESSGYIGLLADINLIGVRLFLFLTAFLFMSTAIWCWSCKSCYTSRSCKVQWILSSGHLLFCSMLTHPFLLNIKLSNYFTGCTRLCNTLSKFQFNSHYWCIWDLFSCKQPPTISDKKLTKP